MATGSDDVVVGVDLGTLSARAVVVRVADGVELATAVSEYRHGVMDTTLAQTGVALPPDWALQVPGDYVDSLAEAVAGAVRAAGVASHQVVGIGTDFTACTVLPVLADGTPLCELPEYVDRPHAYVKLWKHHAAQAHADRLNRVAHERAEPWIGRYGGKLSSEWALAKGLQLLEEDPELYHRMDHWIEAADWIVWQLCGTHVRNACTAGFKAARTGLPAGIAVSVGNVDAHVTAPAARAVEAGQMVAIMGTSTCHVMIADDVHAIAGMCGVVDGGIVPGLWGYEAGQSGVGDIFGWFVDHAVPARVAQEAAAAGRSVHEHLSALAAAQPVGAHGLVALDWHSGNRSILVDHDLSGLVVGLTLQTRPEDVYRALVEATAFGTRVIVDTFDAAGVPVRDLIVAGGLLRNSFVMQVYADVLRRPLHVIGSEQGPALGSALHAAVAAGAHADIVAASAAMGRVERDVWKPDPARADAYDALFDVYRELHDRFGAGGGDLMHRLRSIRKAARA